MTDKTLTPLGKVYDGEHPTRERDQAADDVYDIVMADIQGRSEIGDGPSAADQEADIRAERLFFAAVSEAVTERCKEWLAGRFRISYLASRDGYRFSAGDREGRVYEVEITYSEFSEVAARQRNTDKNLTHMADEVARKLTNARRYYFERMKAAEIGIG